MASEIARTAAATSGRPPSTPDSLPANSGCSGRISNSIAVFLVVRCGADPSVEPDARKLGELADQMGNVGPQAGKAWGLLERLLVHIERAVDLDLQAVPPCRRAPLPLDDLDPLVDLV